MMDMRSSGAAQLSRVIAAALLMSLHDASLHAQKSTSVSRLRQRYAVPAKSPYETQAQYVARIPKYADETFRVRVVREWCGNTMFAMRYNAENKVLTASIGAPDGQTWDYVGSGEFAGFDTNTSAPRPVIISAGCTVTLVGREPMSSAFGATVIVDKVSLRGLGILAPSVMTSEHTVWRLRRYLEPARAKMLVEAREHYVIDADICLLPDEMGRVLAQATSEQYPTINQPRRQAAFFDLIRASVYHFTVRDSRNNQVIIEDDVENLCPNYSGGA